MKRNIGLLYPRSNQLLNILRQPAEQASRPKDNIGKKQTCLPPKYIAQFAIQGLERTQCQEIRTRDPTRQVEGLQVAANFSVACDNDCLVGCC